MVREFLKLGNPQLYERSSAVVPEELPLVEAWVRDLHDTLMEYRRVYGAGQAVDGKPLFLQQMKRSFE